MGNQMRTDLKRLLVVDDDMEDCLIFEEALRRVDDSIEFLSTQDGTQAIEIIQRYAPGIVFTGCNMPRIAGIDCLREIKSHYPELPVIVYTGLKKDNLTEKAYEHGSELVIEKPASFARFVDTLRAIFRFDWKQRKRIREKYYGSCVTFPIDRY